MLTVYSYHKIVGMSMLMMTLNRNAVVSRPNAVACGFFLLCAQTHPLSIHTYLGVLPAGFLPNLQDWVKSAGMVMAAALLLGSCWPFKAGCSQVYPDPRQRLGGNTQQTCSLHGTQMGTGLSSP